MSHFVATVGGNGQRLQSRFPAQPPSSETCRIDVTLRSLGSTSSFYNVEGETEAQKPQMNLIFSCNSFISSCFKVFLFFVDQNNTCSMLALGFFFSILSTSSMVLSLCFSFNGFTLYCKLVQIPLDVIT